MPGHASLHLETKTIPELVAALRDQEVPCFVAPETWRSLGTFSVRVENAASLELRNALADATHLRVYETRHGILIEGAMPCVRVALASEVPGQHERIRRKLDELKAGLVAALRRREPLAREKAAVVLAFVTLITDAPPQEEEHDRRLSLVADLRQRRDECLAALRAKSHEFDERFDRGGFGAPDHRASHLRRLELEAELDFLTLRGLSTVEREDAWIAARKECKREWPFLVEMRRLESQVAYLQLQLAAAQATVGRVGRMPFTHELAPMFDDDWPSLMGSRPSRHVNAAGALSILREFQRERWFQGEGTR